MGIKGNTSKEKGAKPKKVKPLTRIMTAPVITTNSEPDNFIHDLALKVDAVIRDEYSGKKRGRPRKYEPIELWEKFLEYLEFVKEHPAKIERSFSSGVIAVHTEERPLKLIDFYKFAGITQRMFQYYETNEEFTVITAHIRDLIFSQKFDGAARGKFDSNLIARDLGIGDKLDVAGLYDASKPIKIVFGKGNENAPKQKK